MKLLDKQREFFEIPHKEELDVCIYQGGYTCVPDCAEYLSEYGWKRIDTLTKDDKLAVYYDNGEIKFEHPKDVFIWNADEWYEFHTRTLHQKLCPNHKVVTWKYGKKYVQTMAEFYAEHQKSKNGHIGKFKTTATLNKYDIRLTEEQIQFMIAFQADGHKVKDGTARFHFSKQRKIDRLIGIVNKLGFKYEIKKYNDGDTYIVVKAPDFLLVKEFNKVLYGLDSKYLKLIIDEVKYWDGTEGKTHNCYYTSIKENADFIQFAGTMSGYRSTIFSRNRNGVIEYRVNFNKNITPSLVCTRSKAKITVTKAKKGEKKYCPSTSTGMWLMRYDNKIVVTGNSGKTWCGSLLGISLSQKYPGCKGLVGAKEYELVRKTTLVSYLEHLDALGFTKRDYNYNKVDKTITFSNGSEILFSALDDPEKFKSLNLHWAEIEEASQISDSSFKQLLGRLRNTYRGKDWENFRYRLFGHTNPQPNKDWIWKRFVEKKLPNYRLIIAPTTNNTYLPKHFVESMKDSFDEEYYKINVLGEFGDYNSGLVVKGFTDNNIKSLKYCEALPLHLSFDFNVDPLCFYAAHKDDENIYVFDEFCIENTNTEMAFKEFMRRYPKKDAEIVIHGDASGDFRSTQSEYTNYAIMRKLLNENGYTNFRFELRPYNPPILNRVAAFNARVKNSDGIRHFFVDKKCKWLLYNIYNLKYKEGTSIIDVPSIVTLKKDRDTKFLSHPFDAISYMVEYYYKIR